MKVEANNKILIIVAIFFIAVSSHVWGAQNSTVTASVRIIGRDLAISADDINFGIVDLTRGQSSASAENTLTISDPTGTKSGWHVTIRGTDFVSRDGKNCLHLDSINFVVQDITPDRVNAISGNKIPYGVGQQVKISHSDQKIVFANKKEGMGRFEVRFAYRIDIPMNASSGEYSGGITYTIFQGP